MSVPPDTPDLAGIRRPVKFGLLQLMQNALASCKVQWLSGPSRLTRSCKSMRCNKSSPKLNLSLTCTE